MPLMLLMLKETSSSLTGRFDILYLILSGALSSVASASAGLALPRPGADSNFVLHLSSCLNMTMHWRADGVP